MTQDFREVHGLGVFTEGLHCTTYIRAKKLKGLKTTAPAATYLVC